MAKRIGGLSSAMGRSLRWCEMLALCAAFVTSAKAQDEAEEVFTIELPPGIVLPQMPSGAAGAANPAATTTPKTPEEKRLDELLKLKFDRSAASILQAQAELVANTTPNPSEPEQFRRNVVAGRWNEVGAFLKTLPEKDAAKLYEYLLKDLARVQAATPNQGQQVMGPAPSSTLLQQDIPLLADIAPAKLTDEQLKLLGALLVRTLAGNSYLDPLLKQLDAGTAQLGGSDPSKRELAAQFLLDAGRDLDAAKFLPPLEAGRETTSLPLLEKHVRCIFSQGRADSKKETIQRAWELNQVMLAATDVLANFRERAWQRALEIAPFLPTAAATQWMKDTFASDPQRGLTLLNRLAAQLGAQRSNRDPAQRRKNLELQRQVVDALLPDTAHRAQWQNAVNLFAKTWMEEADYSRRYYQPPRQQNMQYDEFGNRMFYGNQTSIQNFGSNQLPPIPLPEVVTTAPGKEWLAALDPSLLPRALASLAQAQLKLEDDAKALPFIEQLAPFQPKETLALANELLTVWANARDPQRNMPQRRSNMIYYSSGMYGAQQQGVPLTRALQQRHLEELSANLARLRKLPLGALDDNAIVAAFTAAHSPAEVYREESIELVLGKVDQIKPETLAALLQAMRARLGTQWRKPSVQQQAKTQRTDAQIDKEVLDGYGLLGELLEKGLARQPDDWRLHLAQASTWFDWAEFQYGKKVDLAIYVEKRERAFAEFQRAAALYARGLPKMEQSAETPEIYQQWLNANLGASDLAFVTRQQEANAKSLLKIREAMLALPGEASQRHLDALAKAVSESTDTLPAHLKPGYMRAAMAVIGERETTAEIKKLVEYYDSLLREIEVSVRVDGDATVGHGTPFGVFLTVRHTSELERENAGGFGKYLRNQSQSQYYFNPYGTPPIDHRDNLEKQIREKLGEGFEIQSVTFHDDKVQSRGYGRLGWRETPLAYLLLKAKDASVDRIPALRLDVDFIDKHGPVVLPVESSPLLIDARPEAAPARPVSEMEITEVLDDRTLAEGKLMVEIKATAKGLVPPFQELFEFAPTGFKIAENTDSGPAVVRFDSIGDELAGASERTWVLTLMANSAKDGGASFQFPKAKPDGVKVAYKRYHDADLVEVSPTLALTGLPLRSERVWLWVLLGGLVVALPGWMILRVLRRPKDAAAEIRYTLPEETTPFATLNLLRRMHADERLAFSQEQRAELSQAIAGIEGFYFARRNGALGADLEAIGRAWVARTGQRAS